MGCRQCRKKKIYKTALDVYEIDIIFNEERRRRGRAVTSPRSNEEMTFHVNILLENVCIVVQKYILQQCFSLSFFLICSYFPINFEADVL